MALVCKLVLDDWRQLGLPTSIYSTELGCELSMGDLHGGTTFDAKVVLEGYIEEEITAAMRAHKAYPVFRLIVEDREKEDGLSQACCKESAGPGESLGCPCESPVEAGES